MKFRLLIKISITLLILTSLMMSVNAQHFDFFGFSGYTFGDKFPISGGRAKVYGGHTYGGSLSYTFAKSYNIEVLYSKQDSRVTAYSAYDNLDVDKNISLNYIMAGGNKLLPFGEKVQVFSGVKMGALIFTSSESSFQNVVKFAVGLNAGVNYFFLRKLGFGFNGSVNFPVADLGANFWWSPVSGGNVGISSYVPFVQFGFRGGIVYRIGE